MLWHSLFAKPLLAPHTPRVEVALFWALNTKCLFHDHIAAKMLPCIRFDPRRLNCSGFIVFDNSRDDPSLLRFGRKQAANALR